MYALKSGIAVILLFSCLSCSNSKPAETTVAQVRQSPTPAPADASDDFDAFMKERRSLAAAKIREIVPTAEGGAYIISTEDRIWYLRGPVAIPIREDASGKVSLRSPRTSRNKLFALWVRERAQRKSAEDEISDLQEELTDLKGELDRRENNK